MGRTLRATLRFLAYFVFPKDGGDPILVTEKPAGIVYHTSESDIAPFEPDATGSLLSNTGCLLRWLSLKLARPRAPPEPAEPNVH